MSSRADPYNLAVQHTADLHTAALASFVLGILGFVALPFLGPVLAIVLGEVAMRQTHAPARRASLSRRQARFSGRRGLSPCWR